MFAYARRVRAGACPATSAETTCYSGSGIVMDEVMNWSSLLDALADVLAEAGGEGWLVGGCLRDALLSIPIHDVDVAMTGEPLPVAERLAQRARLAVARLGRGTVR